MPYPPHDRVSTTSVEQPFLPNKPRPSAISSTSLRARNVGSYFLEPTFTNLGGGASPSRKIQLDQQWMHHKIGSKCRLDPMRSSQISFASVDCSGVKDHSCSSNVLTGAIVGTQLVVNAILCATMTWTSGNHAVLMQFLPVGMTINIVGLAVLLVVVGSLTSVPYMFPAVPDTPALMIATAARTVVSICPTEKINGTVLAMMMLLSAMTGVLYILMGTFRICDWMRQLPHSVISGFLSAIGIWVTVSSLAIMSSVPFVRIFPTDVGRFFGSHSVAQMALGFSFFLALRIIPYLVGRRMGPTASASALNLVTIVPIPIFWLVIALLDIEVTTLVHHQWIFPTAETVDVSTMWAHMYDWSSVDLHTLWVLRFDMCTYLAVMCLNAVLGFSGIEASRGKEKTVIDHNKEIQFLGVATITAAFFSAQGGYHQIPLSIAAREAGIYNRLGAYAALAVVVAVHVSSIQLQALMPKWFFGGLFLNLAFLFLKQWMYDALFTMPLQEYVQIWIVALVAVWTSFPSAAVVGITISMIVFIRDATTNDPIKNVRRLDQLSHKAIAWLPSEDLKVLEEIGHEAVWISFQGNLYFGNSKLLYDSLISLVASYHIWDFKDVRSIDVAAAEVLRNTVDILKARGAIIVLSQLSSRASRTMLALQGLYDLSASRSEGIELELGCSGPHEKGKQSIANSLCSCVKVNVRLPEGICYQGSIQEALTYVTQLLLDADKAVRLSSTMVPSRGSYYSVDSLAMTAERSTEQCNGHDEFQARSLPSVLGKDNLVTHAWEVIKTVGSTWQVGLGEQIYDLGDAVSETFFALESGSIDILVFACGYWERVERVQKHEVFGVESYVLHALHHQERAVCSSDSAVVWSVTRGAINDIKLLQGDAYQDVQEFLLRMLASAVRLKSG